jgi:hypothetical protein
MKLLRFLFAACQHGGPTQFHVGFIMDKRTTGQASSVYVAFPPIIYTHSFIYLLLMLCNLSYCVSELEAVNNEAAVLN